MVFLIRSNDIVSDPRAMKYVNFLCEERIDHILIGWDREGKMKDSAESIYYKHRSGYNVGGLKAVINRARWMRFVVKTLLSHKDNGKITIHACDLDAVFPALIYNKLVCNCKRASIIYDVFDWFSATLYNQNRMILTAFRYMERYSVEKSDHIIICEPERIEQIPFDFDKSKLHILPNIPMFNDSSFLDNNCRYNFNNNNLTFAYVGSFVPERCLSELISIAERGIINLNIAGFGNRGIESKLESITDNQNIRYFGKVSYKDGLQIMFNSDIIYAMYSTTNPNHVYAAPNKYYESMFLGKPIFSTKGTMVAKKILRDKIGFVSGESEKEILLTISSINKDSLKEKGKMAHKLWVDKYAYFTYDFLNDTYRNLI